MIDLLVLLGVALCAISVVMAVVSVLRTQAPRAAALAFVLGLVVLFGVTTVAERSLSVASVTDSWNRVLNGEAFGTNTVTAPPPAAAVEQTATSPATSQPAAQAPLGGSASGENPDAPATATQ